jgi:hypothetical protein
MLLRQRICYPRLRAAVPTELDYKNPDLLIGTLTRLFINEGRAREVAVLAYAKAELVQTGYDNWDGGIYDFEIQLEVPHSLYIQLGDDVDAIQDLIADRTRTMLRVYRRDRLDKVIIFAELAAAPGWQGDARAWLSGSGVTNQGRVRSDNIAAREADGLLFRSEPEINLYRGLKAARVSFAPLPVFVRGGQEYRRIEPDFVIVKDGLLMVVEVDGDTVHQETPAEADARTTMLQHEGAHVERVRAQECATPEAAKFYVKHLLQVLAKLKSAR